MTWDVRTNIKAKPGSQGTLFQGGSDQMTEAKWPRGYTPERLNEVLPSAAPYKSDVRDTPYEYGGSGSERRKLVDNIARSTVPGEHLQRLQFQPGTSASGMRHSGPNADPMVPSGMYNKRRREFESHQATVKLLKGQADRPVAIHEIGHHASQEQGTPHSDYDTVQKRGQEEAFADNYAQEHYRPRRGEKYPGVGMYNGGDPDHVRTTEFFNAYHAHRDYRPVFGATGMGVGATKSTPPPPPGSPDPKPPLPGLDAVSIAKAQPRGTLGNRGFK